jgi:hypothetical protein
MDDVAPLVAIGVFLDALTGTADVLLVVPGLFASQT